MSLASLASLASLKSGRSWRKRRTIITTRKTRKTRQTHKTCFRLLENPPPSVIFNPMVKQKSARLNTVFAALSDPTRRAIVEKLSHGECIVGDLAQPFDMSLPAITKHLNVLESAGLITRTRDGRMMRCALVPGPLGDAVDWMERMKVSWNDRFDRLEKFLKSTSH